LVETKENNFVATLLTSLDAEKSLGADWATGYTANMGSLPTAKKQGAVAGAEKGVEGCAAPKYKTEIK
jgi:hypothetical protein